MAKAKPRRPSPWFSSVLDSLKTLRDAVCALEDALRKGGTQWHVNLKLVRATVAELRPAVQRAEADLTPSGSDGEVDALRICDRVLAQDLSEGPLLLTECAYLRTELDVDFDHLANRMGVDLGSTMTNAEAAKYLHVGEPWISKLKKRGTLVAAGPDRVEKLSVYEYEQVRNHREDERERRQRP